MADEVVEIQESEVAVPDLANPGVPDGHVDDNGEKIVYEYDGETLVGWHKEQA